MKDNVLIGKTLTGMKIAADRGALLFQTTEGELVVQVDAGCCSYTWIEHIELPALGFPAVVVSVADLEMPEGAPSTFHTDVPLYPFRVLVACEFSGTVRRAFRRAGFDAWSCDLLPAEDINDGHHFKCDVSVIIHYSFISLPQVKCSDRGTMPVCAPDCPSST